MGSTVETVEPRVAPLTWRAFVATIVTSGVIILLLSARDLVRQPPGITFWVLVGLTIGTGWATLRMRRVPISFSISDTFTMAAALLFGPAAGTVTVAFDVLTMSVRIAADNRRGLWMRILFNLCAAAVPMWVSAQIFFAASMTGPLADRPGTIRELVAPLALFATVYFLLNTSIVAAAVAHERGDSVIRVWREHMGALWLTFFGGASIAAILVLLTATRLIDVKTLSLVLPLLFILHVTYKTAIDRVQEQMEHYAQITVYAAALRSTADAVIVSDREGRITLMNPAAERLSGWTERDAKGRDAAEIFRTLDPKTHKPDDVERNRFGGMVREFLLIRRDHSECPIEEMEAAIRDERGTVFGTIRTFRDISARKALDTERDRLLESERAARNTADAANRLKDEFLATLSHELRTPANGVLGWARLLKTGRMDAAQTRQALEALERSARAQATLIDDLLDMSRIVRGTLKIEPQWTDVADAIRGAVDTVTPAIRSKNIHLELNIGDVPQVNADPNRLRQVFWNLLSNAVKFNEPGGSIRVTVGRERGQARIEIADTGRGIDAEALPFIFERFRQADGSTTRVYGGLGLGLAIARHLVEAHGGTVTASSEGPGRGATFVVYLPAAAAATAS